eukprot:scaffold1282_cov251-Pinguiococcus_pyrenoidosus.AAC.44
MLLHCWDSQPLRPVAAAAFLLPPQPAEMQQLLDSTRRSQCSHARDEDVSRGSMAGDGGLAGLLAEAAGVGHVGLVTGMLREVLVGAHGPPRRLHALSR